MSTADTNRENDRLATVPGIHIIATDLYITLFLTFVKIETMQSSKVSK